MAAAVVGSRTSGKHVDLIVGPLTLAITSLLKNVSFAVYRVPNLPVTELGVSAIIRPHDLAISGFGGMLAITGTIDVERP